MGEYKIIEIKGVGSENKGAEMMLLTIIKEMNCGNVRFTIAPINGSCEYPFYSKLGIYPKIWFSVKGIQLGRIGRFVPKKLRKMYGLVTDEEVDVILDASGFAYSSQWGEFRAKLMAEDSARWNKMGKIIILMPQSFGPFKTKSIKNYMQQIIENVNLIYARDEYSYNKLKEIANINVDKIRLQPDFTSLFEGFLPAYFNIKECGVCIVPNQRVKDKREDASGYEMFLTRIVRILQAKNLLPFFLIHGGREDEMLANKINSLLGYKIKIINEENPYYIKGIIQNSLGLIGSRFHSIASALYCGIPVLGIGWSHKYKYLFQEFDFPDGLIDFNISDMKLHEKIDLFANESLRKDLKQKFSNSQNILKAKSKQMFDEIRVLIGIK